MTQRAENEAFTSFPTINDVLPRLRGGVRRVRLRTRQRSKEMQSQIAKELKMKYHPVAILFTDDKPEQARQLREDRWGCTMALYANVMRKGATAAFDRNTYGCFGGGVGLCLGDTYKPNREFMLKLLADDEAYLNSSPRSTSWTTPRPS